MLKISIPLSSRFACIYTETNLEVIKLILAFVLLLTNYEMFPYLEPRPTCQNLLKGRLPLFDLHRRCTVFHFSGSCLMITSPLSQLLTYRKATCVAGC